MYMQLIPLSISQQNFMLSLNLRYCEGSCSEHGNLFEAQIFLPIDICSDLEFYSKG